VQSLRGCAIIVDLINGCPERSAIASVQRDLLRQDLVYTVRILQRAHIRGHGDRGGRSRRRRDHGGVSLTDFVLIRP